MAERIMTGINQRIRCAKVANTHWKLELSAYIHRNNQTPHSTTGFSLNMLLLVKDECDIFPSINPKQLTEEIKDQT